MGKDRRVWQGTGILASFIWRRDQVRIPVWIVGIALVTFLVTAAYPSLFPTEPERQIMAETMRNPAMISMMGPGYGLDDYHIGAMIGHQMLLFTAVAVAIMNILLMIRHTRRDEEAGRIEVIRSLPVGKLSSVGAAFVVLAITNLVMGLIVGLGMALLGIESINFGGSMLYGACLAVTGLFFAALTALFAQITETSRASMGLSFGFMGVAYLLRAIGDVGSEFLSLISPLGLVLRTEVYVNNYWWPILAMVVCSALVAYFALRLNLIRDLEAGFIGAKLGRTSASRFLQSPLGLALRLQKTMLISWAIGLFVLGMSYGSVFGDLDMFFETSELMRAMLPELGGYSLTDLFASMLLAVMSMITAIPVLLMVFKLKAEERDGYTEHLLARAVSRTKLMGSYLVPALVMTVVMQLLTGLGLWSAAYAVMEEPLALGSILKGSMAYVPVIWVLVGLAVLLIAVKPKLTSLVWLYLGYTFFAVYFGNILQIPKWMGKLTPFGHVPNVPLEEMGLGLVVVMLIIGVGLMGCAFYGFRKRDYGV